MVDENYALKGLITVKDIQKKLKYPNAAKDAQGRLRVGAAIGSTGDFLERAQELVRKKVDVIAIDSAHGHSQRVMDAVRTVKQISSRREILAGNVGSYEGARELIALGADGIKVGIGPGSICTTRVVSGAGVPQITAIAECSRATRGSGRAAGFRRRCQVFGRHHESGRGGRRCSNDRQPFCRHRRKSRRNDPVIRDALSRVIAAWDLWALCRRASLTVTRKTPTANWFPRASRAACLTKVRLPTWSTS